MKRTIIFICIAVLLSGCSVRNFDTDTADISARGKEYPCTEENVTVVSSETDNGVAVQTTVPEKENCTSDQTTSEPEEERVPIEADVSGYHEFTYSAMGLVYSNEELNECFEKLDEICDSANYNLSFSYKNLITGVEIEYRSDSRYLTCSTVKAVYVKYLLENGVDFNDLIYKDSVCDGDYGTVATSDNQYFTAKQLMEYAILESDNTAYYLLVRNYGYVGFNEMLSDIGADFRLSEGVIWTRCTSRDMMKCFADIYEFAENDPSGKWLIDLLSGAYLNIQIGAALGDKYTVAQKYGSEFTEYSFHDCAVVYAQQPFVLSIFTNQYPETEQSCEVFKQLAVVFDEINSLLV